MSEKYSLMQVEKHNYSISRMARLLEVSRSGYYAWVKTCDDISWAQQRRNTLDQLVVRVFDANDGEYGSIRLHAELIAQGYDYSVKSVERSMARQGLRAACKRKYRSSKKVLTHGESEDIYPDLVHRKFDQGEINKVWVTDITYINICATWIYLCAIVDGSSRRVIGWAIDFHHKASLVTRAIDMAVTVRTLALQEISADQKVILHSDHGSQFTSCAVAQLCEVENLTQSMGKTGVCFR